MWRKSIQKIHLPAPSVLSLIITRVEHTLDQYASLLWLICASSGPVRPTVTRRRVISFSTWQTGRVCFLPRSNFRHQSVREGFCLAEREGRVLCCSVKESQWLLPQTDNERLPYWLPLLEKCNETWRCLNKHPELPPPPPPKKLSSSIQDITEMALCGDVHALFVRYQETCLHKRGFASFITKNVLCGEIVPVLIKHNN